jgi:hypothetical protein
MATKRKKQIKKLKFELTGSGAIGIGVIMFCLFLWMFLLGVWAGQSLLLPSYGKKVSIVDKSADQLSEPLVIKAVKKAVKK